MPGPSLIGLTGGIAAGKSEALRILAELGAETLSTDAVVHELLGDRRGPRAAWSSAGATTSHPSGERRPRPGRRRSSSSEPDELAWLESTLHPLVGERVAAWRRGAAATIRRWPWSRCRSCSRGRWRRRSTRPIAVVADDDERARRAPPPAAPASSRRRSGRQLSQEEKAERATHVVVNDGIAGGARGRSLRGLLPELEAAGALSKSPAAALEGRAGRARGGGGSSRSVVVGLICAAVVVGISRIDFGETIAELTLPLRHDDIIRQQAEEKDVPRRADRGGDLPGVAFQDQTSSAGARGLMQITPDTADTIETLSGGETFVYEDLADPELNIRYGTFYLRHLLDRFDGNEVAALAAYNAGPEQAEEWGGAGMDEDDIEFAETRAYVDEVLEKRDEYARSTPRSSGSETPRPRARPASGLGRSRSGGAVARPQPRGAGELERQAGPERRPAGSARSAPG